MYLFTNNAPMLLKHENRDELKMADSQRSKLFRVSPKKTFFGPTLNNFQNFKNTNNGTLFEYVKIDRT